LETIKYFFSYSRQNSEFVIKLATDLKNAKVNVWLDQTDIVPGSRWDDSIQNALNESRGLLVVLSGDSVQSQNVMDEVSFAISNGKRIVPLMIESCSVPFRLDRYQRIDFTGDYNTAFQQLLKTLNAEETNPEKKAHVREASNVNKSQSKEKHPLISNLAKLTGILFIVLAVVIIMINKCPSDLPITTSVTVFVHGKKGKQDMVLRQQGHVVMDLKGGERKRADLNENGAAFFQNLHIGDTVHLEVDFSEPYKSLYPDSAFVIPADGRIYLQVALQGIGNVHGKVLYKEDPLEGVIVEINQLSDTTDGTGKFNIAIPESQQTKEYKVWFTKQGFKTTSATAFPQTGQALEVVMEK
jgi:hypothetical protein